jgi:UDP-2-acetamido-3-amino-2,3-dideoxy-glucuronate N-acetyltransferase
MREYFLHPAALVETERIGPRTRIWAYAHLMPGVSVGADCNICDGAFIESGVRIGRGVTIKNGVILGEGVTVEDGVFLGPHAVFTNDLRPRSPRLPVIRERYADKGWLQPTRVEAGTTVGANATIACGITLGAWCFVAAGSVVLRSVPPHTYVIGNPARPMGHVCVCAELLALDEGRATCPECRRAYAWTDDMLLPVEPVELWPAEVCR